jgi:hypothetical protein
MNGIFQFSLVLGGFVIPLIFAWRQEIGERSLPPWKKGDLFSTSPWILLLLTAAALILRLAFIQTLPTWPSPDESGMGTIGLRISEHWTGRFLYSFGQNPPLTYWIFALAVKAGLNPFLCLWLPPAILSLFTLGLGYFAARRLINPVFALIFGLLLAFSFWPLYIGRHCHETMALPSIEFLALGILAWALNDPTGKGASLRFFFFGLAAGLGFFTFPSWAAAALIAFLLAFWKIWTSKESRFQWFWVLPGMGLSAFPFLWAAFKEGYGNHLVSLTPWSGWFPWTHQVEVDWHYLTVLFWGAFDKEAAYTPVEGGFLNPLWGAFFFLGLLEVVKHRKSAWARWTLISFPLLLLPGLFSMNVEAFRIIQVLPLLYFMTALGLLLFLQVLNNERRWLYLVLFLTVGLVFDVTRMTSPWLNANRSPENFDRPVKSVEKFRAYQILKETFEKQGPGLILADFDTEAQNDATLSLCSRPLSGEWNPAGTPPPGEWAALYVNVHFQPYLDKRLPGVQWFWVGQDLKKADGGSVLAVFPRSSLPVEFLNRWVGLNVLMRDVDEDRLYQLHEDWDPLLAKLSQGESLAKGDPFLESVYWDKVAAFEYGKLDYGAHLAALQHAVKDGYPTAALCFELGNLYLTKGFKKEAEGAFLKATQAPLNLTPSKLLLAQLQTDQPKK